MFASEPIASTPNARVWDLRGTFDAEATLTSFGHDDPRGAASELIFRLLLIRRFEEAAVDLMKQGRIIGAVHSSLGQEAVAVGVCAALGHEDVITGTHRSHGHLLAKGSSPNGLMAELFGKVTGLSRGRGGSMHMADPAIGSLGTSGIVGGGLPIVVGAGYAGRLKKKDTVGVGFFGDGAANEGVVHEAMNLAAVWHTPTVFVCENNGYAVSTPAADAVAGGKVAFRALGYGFDACLVDGQNVLEVLAASTAVVARLRKDPMPFLIEAETYRYREHAEGISLSYRQQSEIDDWISKRDPINKFADAMVSMGILSPQDIAQAESRVQDVVAESVAFAEGSPTPEDADPFEYLYA